MHSGIPYNKEGAARKAAKIAVKKDVRIPLTENIKKKDEAP